LQARKRAESTRVVDCAAALRVDATVGGKESRHRCRFQKTHGPGPLARQSQLSVRSDGCGQPLLPPLQLYGHFCLPFFSSKHNCIILSSAAVSSNLPRQAIDCEIAVLRRYMCGRLFDSGNIYCSVTVFIWPLRVNWPTVGLLTQEICHCLVLCREINERLEPFLKRNGSTTARKLVIVPLPW